MRNLLHPLLAAVLLLGGTLQAQTDALKLAAATDRTIYGSGSRRPIYLEAKIDTADLASGTDTAVRNIALVLDISGSMAGEPMQALRQAAVNALGTLADRDVVSVVLFNSEIETLVAAQRRDQVRDLDVALARIEPAGGSALYDALNQGAAQLRRYEASATANHLVLVTDGPATKGPRERDDFIKLVELFAKEGITLTTIGLGEAFPEDLLADLARTGNGRFRYAATPADLPKVLQIEFGVLRTPCARDVTLQIEFNYGCHDVETAGWEPAQVEGLVVTYRFPAVYSGQEISVLAGAKYSGLGNSPTIATVRLHWREVASSAEHDTSRRLGVYFENGDWASLKSVDLGVLRTTVDAVISEGLQRAIKEIDKGDQRRALRELRRTRDAASEMNYKVDDAVIAARIHVLEAYLAEVQARGINQLDRKILRSGLNNQFETPTEEPDKN